MHVCSSPQGKGNAGIKKQIKIKKIKAQDEVQVKGCLSAGEKVFLPQCSRSTKLHQEASLFCKTC